jgi:pectate lyase
VVRGLRHRGTPSGTDAVRVYNSSNVVMDRMSVSGFGDGAIDVTENSRDVTIQWSILGDGNPDHNFPSLVKYETSRVTLHHNLYINGIDRHPFCGRADGAKSLPSEVVCDVRNNVVWNYRTGTSVRQYGTANVINNYYFTKNSSASASSTIYVSEGGSVHASGNRSGNGWDVNARSNRSSAYSAIAPKTTDAVTAGKEVKAKAGARGPRFGLDTTDQGYVSQVDIR